MNKSKDPSKGKDNTEKTDLPESNSSKVNEKEKFINELHSTHTENSKLNARENDRSTHGEYSGNRTSQKHRSKHSSSSHKRSHSTSTRDKESKLNAQSCKDISASNKSHCTKDDATTHNERDLSQGKDVSPSCKQNSPSFQDTTSAAKANKIKISSDTSKLKGTVDDDDELVRKEVTAEDVAKAENLIKKITASSSSIGNFSQYEEDGSEAVPSISSDIEHSEPNANDSYSEIVSSTVTIKTPDTSGLNISSDSNPIVWKGDIHMPDVATFSVKAKQVSGTTDYLTVDLKEALKIVGRIAPQTVWDYVSQISESPSKEILLVKLEPTTDDEKINYTSFFNYLQQRNR